MAHTAKLNTFHLFAGAGGGILADLLLGHNPIGACEIEEYPRNVLLARQRDGILPSFPIWDDICTLDGKPWRGLVDVVCGGFPCQDISAAGKGAGIDGERSGLWGEMARIIREIRPRYAFVENSPMLTSRGLHRVLGDLAEMGYDAKWCVLGACDAGAPHRRDRIWILAELVDAKGERHEQRRKSGDFCKAHGRQVDGLRPITAEPGAAQTKLADSSVHGLAPTEKREGADERSNERTTGTQQASESTGLCAAGEHRDVAEGGEVAGWWAIDPADICDTEDWPTKSGVGRMVDGLADKLDFAGTPFTGNVPRVANGVKDRVNRLKAIGNGQVSLCAAVAFQILSRGLV